MARKLAVIAGELASWSTYYLRRDHDLDGTPQYGPLSDRAVYLEHIVERLEEVEEMLCNMPRTS